MRQEHEPTIVTSRGYDWCTRTKRWKVRFDSPAAAYDMADTVLKESDDVVFVYQCLRRTRLRINKKGRVVATRFLGCMGYHLTKRPRPNIGSLGIAHCWLGDSEAGKVERFQRGARTFRSYYAPPAPVLVGPDGRARSF
jgi:hypothetical protein